MNHLEQAVKRAVENNELFNTYFIAIGITALGKPCRRLYPIPAGVG